MDVILYTSRGVPVQGDGAGGLVFGERVGAALVACVAGLTGRPRFLVSKGGITSSDVATQALGMKRAQVSRGLLYRFRPCLIVFCGVAVGCVLFSDEFDPCPIQHALPYNRS